jgi:hypothetical protein
MIFDLLEGDVFTMKRWKFFALVLTAALLWSGVAGADVFYSATDGTASTFGTISGADRAIAKDLYSLPLGYPVVASFSDLDGKEWVAVEHYQWGSASPSTVDIFDLKDWTKPAGGEYTNWGTNIKGVAIVENYLYIAAFERIEGGEDRSGEIIRVDLSKPASAARPFDPDGAAYKFSAREGILRRPCAIEVINGRIYVLTYTYDGTHTVDAGMGASEIFEFDEDLVLLRSETIGNDVSSTNTQYMSSHGGKLYLGSIGGAQGAGAVGAIWEVDPSGESLTAVKVWDLGAIADIGDSARSVYGIDIAPDGTAFVVVGGYDADWSFSSKLYVSTASKLSAGEYSDPVSVPAGAYIESIAYDSKLDTLWCALDRFVNGSLEARDRSGRILKTITPSELGNSIGNFTIIGETPRYEKDAEGESGGGGCDAGFGLVSLLIAGYAALLKSRWR